MPIEKAQEYEVLHAELAQNKRYVFERPFVIVGVGIGLATYLGPEYGAALLVLFVGVLLFDYLFTVDRLRSNCRIIAYIHVVLESERESRGWETSLREFRIWTWSERKGVLGRRPPNRNVIAAEKSLERLAVPVKSGHWRPILRIHGILVFLSLIVGVVLTWVEPTWTNVTPTIALVIEGFIFARLSWRYRSSKMISLVERDIVLWKGALDPTAMRHWRASLSKTTPKTK